MHSGEHVGGGSFRTQRTPRGSADLADESMRSAQLLWCALMMLNFISFVAISSFFVELKLEQQLTSAHMMTAEDCPDVFFSDSFSILLPRAFLESFAGFSRAGRRCTVAVGRGRHGGKTEPQISGRASVLGGKNRSVLILSLKCT